MHFLAHCPQRTEKFFSGEGPYCTTSVFKLFLLFSVQCSGRQIPNANRPLTDHGNYQEESQEETLSLLIVSVRPRSSCPCDSFIFENSVLSESWFETHHNMRASLSLVSVSFLL